MALDAFRYEGSGTHADGFHLGIFNGERTEGENPRKNRNDWVHAEEAHRLHAMGTREPPQSILDAMHHYGPDLDAAGDSRVRYLISEEDARGQPPTRFTEALQYFTEQSAEDAIDAPLEIRQATRRRLGIDVPEPVVGARENLALFTMTGSPADIALVYTKPAPVDIGELMDLPDAQRVAYLNGIYRRRLLLTGGFSLTEDRNFRDAILSLARTISRVRGTIPANALTDGDALRELLLDHFGTSEELIAALKRYQPDSPLTRSRQPDVLLSPRGAIANPAFFPDATLSLAEWDLDQEEAGRRASGVLFDVLQHKLENGDSNFGGNRRALDLEYPPRAEEHERRRKRAA